MKSRFPQDKSLPSLSFSIQIHLPQHLDNRFAHPRAAGLLDREMCVKPHRKSPAVNLSRIVRIAKRCAPTTDLRRPRIRRKQLSFFTTTVPTKPTSDQVLGPFSLREINKLACLVIVFLRCPTKPTSKIYSRISFFQCPFRICVPKRIRVDASLLRCVGNQYGSAIGITGAILLRPFA